MVQHDVRCGGVFVMECVFLAHFLEYYTLPHHRKGPGVSQEQALIHQKWGMCDCLSLVGFYHIAILQPPSYACS